MFYLCLGIAEPIPCPVGTYSPVTKLQKESDCLSCTGGEFCNETAMTHTAGKCTAGYYCPPRSTGQKEIVCPEGKYCITGTEHPEPCPSGTFSNSTQLTNSSECIPCTKGWYCDDPGLVKPKGPCHKGYYCETGQTNSKAKICGVGTFCPTGTSLPKKCLPGTYAPNEGMDSCVVCPTGKYCTEPSDKG